MNSVTFSTMIISDLKFLDKAAKAVPEKDECERVLQVIKRGHPFDHLFFERLQDPRWIHTLVSNRYFSDLPIGEAKGDGTVSYPRSHALRGLTNIATKAPHEVLEVLESLTIPENPTVKDQLMRILAEIQDANLVERVLVMAARVIKTPPSTNIIWIDQILKNGLKAGALDHALQLIDTFLNVTLSANSIQAIDTWQIGEIDRDILTPISESLPIPSARVVFSTFVKWADIQRIAETNQFNQIFEDRSDFSRDDADSPSSYWLEDFHGLQCPGMGFHDFEVFLAHRLFGIGSLIFRSNKKRDIAEFDEILRSNSWNLFARLRWQLYADFPDQTLQFAKKDIVSRLSLLGHYSGAHGYEMAQMLEKHSLLHGDRFLNPDEVRCIVDTVRSGPVDREGNKEDEKYSRDRFHRQQLHPIRCLLKNGDLEFYERLSIGVPEIKSENYKPLSTGRAYTVEQVPPAKAAEMASMTDSTLWKFLNEWVPEPKHGPIEEDVGALAVKFAELLEATPNRFNASTLWWKNLTRPSVLSKPLERATARISEEAKGTKETSKQISENDWRNWFGLASWIPTKRTDLFPFNMESGDVEAETEYRDWNWPCLVVVNFLTTTLRSKIEFPAALVIETGRLLRQLIQDPDLRLNDEKPLMDDWLTTAINSVRGAAVEGLLELALFHKRHGNNPDPDNWIFKLVESRLKMPDESPAVFAILGSNLRLLLFLFQEQLKSQPELLLPAHRKRHLYPFLLSHVRYDNPMTHVVQTLPGFPKAAIDCLAEMVRKEQPKQEARGDYGGRLGTHLGFYYWNKAFPDQETADQYLDLYFTTANPKHRGTFIREIARMFQESTPTDDMRPLHEMVRNLWDRRFSFIERGITARNLNPVDVRDELSSFIGWLECECHPFEWRHDRILRAIKLLDGAPRASMVIKTLEKSSAMPDRLHQSLEILEALMSKDTQELRWSYQEKHLKPILLRGLGANSPETRKLAERIQEELLMQGFFEYLDLQPA